MPISISNWIVAITILFTTLFSMTAGAQQSSDENPVGYDSVDEALQALQSDSNVQMTTHDSWTVAVEQQDGATVIWSFTPEDHIAHPAVIRREFSEQEGLLSIGMAGLCEAEEEPCDLLFQQFREMDAQMLEN